MTAIHLINRPPSRTIEFKRLIEIMEQHFPTVRLRSGLVPWVFGCVTYVYAHNMQIDKLSTKAVKAVFEVISIPKKVIVVIIPPLGNSL